MKSSFFEFHVATTGLFTARGNLQVTSHNVANAETPGYSRQYAMQRTTNPLTFYNGKGMIGTGSEVYGVGQIRDFYLDKKYWSERCVLGEYGAKKVQLDVIEAVFNDLSGNGLSGVFNDFFAKLQSLAENSGNPTYRTDLIQSANSLISLVKMQANSLKKQQQDINTEVKAVVDRINSLGQQICSLNKQISLYEMDGASANDLRDERARLVDELSLYVNVEVTEKEMNADYAAGKYGDADDRNKSDKRFSVLINGYELVNHYTVTKLDCVPRADGAEQNPMDAKGLYDLYFSNGVKFNIYSTTLKGELKGLIDVRDGNNSMTQVNGTKYNTTYKGIPHYMERLNELVRTFAKAVNEGLDRTGNAIPGVIGHVEGSTRQNPGETGYLFFTIKPSTAGVIEQKQGSIQNYDDMNVFNIGINSEIINDPYKIAAAMNSGTRGNAEAAARSYYKVVAARNYISTPNSSGKKVTEVLKDLTEASKTAAVNLQNNVSSGEVTTVSLSLAEAALEAAKKAEEAAKAIYEAKQTILDEANNVSIDGKDALKNAAGLGQTTDSDKLDEIKAANDAVTIAIKGVDDSLGLAIGDAKAAEDAHDAAKKALTKAQEVYNLVKIAAEMDDSNLTRKDNATKAAIDAINDTTTGLVELAGKAYNAAVTADGTAAAEETRLTDLVNKIETAANPSETNTGAIMELSNLMVEYGWEPSDESDNNVILSLLKLKDYSHLFKEGKLSDFINAISTELGIDIKQATKFESNYTDVTVTINNQRMAVSGVDINEEMINMIKFQQLYQAAAKLINIIDSIYDTTINRLGAW